MQNVGDVRATCRAVLIQSIPWRNATVMSYYDRNAVLSLTIFECSIYFERRMIYSAFSPIPLISIFQLRLRFAWKMAKCHATLFTLFVSALFFKAYHFFSLRAYCLVYKVDIFTLFFSLNLLFPKYFFHVFQSYKKALPDWNSEMWWMLEEIYFSLSNWNSSWDDENCLRAVLFNHCS